MISLIRLGLLGLVNLDINQLKTNVMKLLSIKEMQREFEFDYYMYVPLTIILNSCIGSIAAMTILMQGTSLLTGIELTICVSLCMGYNAALLAGANRKLTFWLLAVSLVVNLLLILVTLL